MKRKDAKIKEAKGRKSRIKGGENRARIVAILMEQPLGFNKLSEEVKLSSPVLSNHLKALIKDGLIQKAFARDGKVVYRVFSKKKAVTFLNAIVSAILLAIIGRKLSAETMDSIRRDLEQVVSEKTESEFTESMIEKMDESKTGSNMKVKDSDMKIN